MCLLMRVLSKLSLLLVRSGVNTGGGGNEGRGSAFTEPKQVLLDAEKRTQAAPCPSPTVRLWGYQ